MASNDDWKLIQTWKQKNVLAVTILIVEYRCSDLLRLIIAKEVISSQSVEKFLDLLDELKDKKYENVGKLVEEFESEEEKEHYLNQSELERQKEREVATKEWVIFQSTEEEERSLDQNDPEQSEEWVEKRKEDIKFSKIEILAKIIKAKRITFGQLIEIINGDHEVIEKTLAPINSLKFQPKWSDKKIEIEFTDTQDNTWTTDTLTEADPIPQTTDLAHQSPNFKSQTSDSVLQPSDPVPQTRPRPDPIALLNEISDYRNAVVHPLTDEVKLEELYGDEEIKARLKEPYAKFLRYVNFKEYFPLDTLDKKVQHFLDPLATAEESDLVIAKYDKLREKLEAESNKKVQELAEEVDRLGIDSEELNVEKQNLTRQLNEWKEKNELNRKIIQDCKDFKRNCDRSRADDIKQMLDELSLGHQYNHSALIKSRMQRLYTFTQYMKEEREKSNVFWETLMRSWRPLTKDESENIKLNAAATDQS